MAQVLIKENVGLGLEVETSTHKLQVKAGSGIVVDNAGVSIDTSVLPEVPKAVKDIAISGRTVTKTFTDNTTATEDLPAEQVDVKFASAVFEDGKMKVTLSDGSTVDTEFSSTFFLAAFKGLNDTQKDEVVAAILPALVKAIKGEVIEDFTGQSGQKGFLLKKDL